MSVLDMLQEVVAHYLEEDGDPREVHEALSIVKAEVNEILSGKDPVAAATQTPATLGHFVGMDEEPSHGYWEAGDHG